MLPIYIYICVCVKVHNVSLVHGGVASSCRHCFDSLNKNYNTIMNESNHFYAIALFDLVFVYCFECDMMY